MVVFTFAVLDQKYTFLGKFSSKNQNCQFKLKFGTQTNSNMQSSVVLFTFSDFDHKYPFWVNLARKIKIVSLSLKFGTQPNLNMQNSMLMFNSSVLTGIPFLGKFGPKNQNCPLKLKLSTQTNSNMQNSMITVHLICVRLEMLFLTKLDPKNQIVSLN